MSYTALYRKFRPTEFDQVKGQDHIVTTLQNQIKNDRIGHAYLFTGTRGTGKTTMAKLFAKAVNCEHPVDGSPCGTCPMCQAIAAGHSMNVIEMDAASNNSVDNIRQIIEEVTYPPTEGKYKVYIVDEVHMLSAGAFNALLKTLEEPPSYVIFILATTEVHKVPITIMSRCQRYDFHRISIDTIAARLQELMDQEGITVEDKAIRYIAKAADGSMRDALSLLDECIAFYIGEELTYEKVLEVLGAVDTEIFSRLLRDIISGNLNDAMLLVEEVVTEGRELGLFVSDFTWYLRNLLLLKSTDQMEDILDISADNLKLLKEEADMVEDAVLMRYIRILSDLSQQLRYATQKRVLIEVALIRMCKPEMGSDYEAMVNRIANLENKVKDGVPVQAIPAGMMQAIPSVTPVEKVPLPDIMPSDAKLVAEHWNEMALELDPPYNDYVREAFVTVGQNGEFHLYYDGRSLIEKFKYDTIANDEVLDIVTKAVSEKINRTVKLVPKLSMAQAPLDAIYTDIRTLFGNSNIAVGEDEEDPDPDTFE